MNPRHGGRVRRPGLGAVFGKPVVGDMARQLLDDDVEALRGAGRVGLRVT